MTEAYKPLVGAAGRVSQFFVVHPIKSFDGPYNSDIDVQHVRGSGAVVANSSGRFLEGVNKFVDL
jgi:hypothetical protein